MLRLTRKRGERIMVGDDIVIEIGFIRDRTVEVIVRAPTDIPVHREEIYNRIQAEIQAGKEAEK